MTLQEFDNEFDVLYNNITSNQAPGLDAYEKSVFLTKAQDEILKAYFNPRTNKSQEGFDGSEIRQIDFSMVIATQDYDDFRDAVFDPRPNSVSIALKPDILMLLNEVVTVKRERNAEYLQVVPVPYNEYRRLMSKPFKRPLKYQAWRLTNTANNNNTSDIIIGPNDDIVRYSIRYVRRPKPIILYPITENGLSLGGGYVGADTSGNPTTIHAKASQGLNCELDPILHPEILQRAVELAKAAYIGDLNSQIALGQVSQTNIGTVTQSR